MYKYNGVFYGLAVLNVSSKSIKTLESRICLFVWLVGFLTSSPTTRLYRGRVPRLTSDNFYVLPVCHTRDRAGRPWILSQPVIESRRRFKMFKIFGVRFLKTKNFGMAHLYLKAINYWGGDALHWTLPFTFITKRCLESGHAAMSTGSVQHTTSGIPPSTVDAAHLSTAWAVHTRVTYWRGRGGGGDTVDKTSVEMEIKILLAINNSYLKNEN